MNRRKFLGTVALGAGATALPVWLSRAFRLDEGRCPEPVDAGEPEGEMTDPGCLPGTQGALKPTLIFVIPSDDRAQYLRGHAFGELLNHGSDAQLAPLACFDVVCRKITDLGPRWRGGLFHEPLMVLDDPNADTMLALDAPLSSTPEGVHDETPAQEEARIDARIHTLARLIAEAADGARLAQQACQERARLPPSDLRPLEELPHSLGELQPTDVDRAPATTTLLARSADPIVRDHLTALLAAGVRARLCQQRIDGAPWARAGGCGVRIEGEPRNSGIMCGMGHTPERSRRFLMFYVSEY